MESDPGGAVAAWIALAPDDAAWARRVVEPYAAMSPAERLRALAAPTRCADTRRAARAPARADGAPPPRMHRQAPSLGRAR